MSERVLKIYALLGWLALVVLGATQVTNWATDNYSDEIMFREMQEVAAGRHRYGIVSITHYPNGPGYLFLPLLKFGVQSDRAVRWVPYTFSILVSAFLIFSLISLPLSRKARALLLSAWLALSLLPGYVYWQGDIHEHSFALSLALASITILLNADSSKKKAPLLIQLGFVGFLSAWMGFDFLPVQCVTTLVVAWIMGQAVQKQASLSSLRWALTTAAVLALGMVLGITSHLWQNALYFDSWAIAWNDLLGSATARAGLDASAQALNPEYFRGLENALAQTQISSDRLTVTWAMAKEFFLKWGSPLWTTFFSAVLFLIPMLILGPRKERWLRWLKTFSLPLILGLLASVSWIALMPKHSVAHFHFLPRHFIVGLLSFAIALVASTESVRHAEEL